MSEQIPAVPTARLDPPPPDVQAAVTAALHACHSWQPISAPPGEPVKPGSSFPALRLSTEAGVCNMIDNWPKNVEANTHFVLGVGVALGLAVALALLELRRGWRAFGRSRFGWHVVPMVEELAMCGLVGAMVSPMGLLTTSMLFDVLNKCGLGVDPLSLPVVLSSLLAGFAGGVWLWRIRPKRYAPSGRH